MICDSNHGKHTSHKNGFWFRIKSGGYWVWWMMNPNSNGTREVRNFVPLNFQKTRNSTGERSGVAACGSSAWPSLVGGSEHFFLFFHILGIIRNTVIIPIDWYFQRGSNHQPDQHPAEFWGIPAEGQSLPGIPWKSHGACHVGTLASPLDPLKWQDPRLVVNLSIPKFHNIWRWK